MTNDEMFASCERSTGDQAGVFEYDGETGYFYLYDTTNEENRKIIDAIRVLTTAPDFDEEDIDIRWDAAEKNVGLFIRRQLWAAFDSKTRAKFGGNYRPGVRPVIPEEISSAFGL